MFDHHGHGQRQRSGSAEGEVAVRILDPEPINFLAPQGISGKADRSFSQCAGKVRTW